jgi:hypothetical protein
MGAGGGPHQQVAVGVDYASSLAGEVAGAEALSWDKLSSSETGRYQTSVRNSYVCCATRSRERVRKWLYLLV